MPVRIDLGNRPIAGAAPPRSPGCPGKARIDELDHAATEPGAVLLWEVTPTRVPLEGSVASLVVESVDFERAPVASKGAIWYLEMDLSIDLPFRGCYRVCINTRHPLCRRLEDAIERREDDPYADAALSAFGWDVARAMLIQALDSEELLERWDDEFDGASAGGHRRLARMCFPEDDGQTMRKRRDEDRAAFERGVQAFVGLLRQ